MSYLIEFRGRLLMKIIKTFKSEGPTLQEMVEELIKVYYEDIISNGVSLDD